MANRGLRRNDDSEQHIGVKADQILHQIGQFLRKEDTPKSDQNLSHDGYLQPTHKTATSTSQPLLKEIDHLSSTITSKIDAIITGISGTNSSSSSHMESSYMYEHQLQDGGSSTIRPKPIMSSFGGNMHKPVGVKKVSSSGEGTPTFQPYTESNFDWFPLSYDLKVPLDVEDSYKQDITYRMPVHRQEEFTPTLQTAWREEPYSPRTSPRSPKPTHRSHDYTTQFKANSPSFKQNLGFDFDDIFRRDTDKHTDKQRLSPRSPRRGSADNIYSPRLQRRSSVEHVVQSSPRGHDSHSPRLRRYSIESSQSVESEIRDLFLGRHHHGAPVREERYQREHVPDNLSGKVEYKDHKKDSPRLKEDINKDHFSIVKDKKSTSSSANKKVSPRSKDSSEEKSKQKNSAPGRPKSSGSKKSSPRQDLPVKIDKKEDEKKKKSPRNKNGNGEQDSKPKIRKSSQGEKYPKQKVDKDESYKVKAEEVRSTRESKPMAWEVDFSDLLVPGKKKRPHSARSSTKINANGDVDRQKKEEDKYNPPKNTATQELMAKRKVMDQRRWFCISRPQYKTSCGLSSLVSCWNYLFSTLGVGSLAPITQEQALTVLGFSPPFAEIKFGPFTGNRTLMRWYRQLNEHYHVRGRSYFVYKPHGRNQTYGVTSNDALQSIKTGLTGEQTTYIYHCQNHYFCPIGYEDVPIKAEDAYRVDLSDDQVETWMIIGEPSRKQPVFHCKKWEEIDTDLNCQNPDFLDIRRTWRGMQKRKTKKTGGNLHCVMAFQRSKFQPVKSSDMRARLIAKEKQKSTNHSSSSSSSRHRKPSKSLSDPAVGVANAVVGVGRGGMIGVMESDMESDCGNEMRYESDSEDEMIDEDSD